MSKSYGDHRAQTAKALHLDRPVEQRSVSLEEVQLSVEGMAEVALK